MVEKHVIRLRFWAMLSFMVFPNGETLGQEQNNPSSAPTAKMITAMAQWQNLLSLGDGTGRIVIVDTKHVKEVQAWVAHDGPIRRLQARGGFWLSVGADGSTALWNAEGRVQWRRRLSGYALNDAALGSGGQLVVGGDRGIVARIDPDSSWRSNGEHGRGTFAVDIDPQGLRVASGGADGRITIRSLDAGKVEKSWSAHDHWVTAILWTDRGIWSAGDEGIIKLWAHNGHGPQVKTRALDGPVLRLEKFRGMLFASAGSGQIAGYDVSDGKLGPHIKVEGGGFYPLAADEDRLYFGTPQGTVEIWRPGKSMPNRRLWPIEKRGNP